MRILLIGKPETTERMGSALGRAGHAVTTVGDLVEATETLIVQRFDAVVLTPGEPDIDISEFTAAVRELDLRVGEKAHTPVLSVVADGAGSLQPPCGSGIDEVLPESIDADALTLAIVRLAAAVGTEKSAAKAQDLAPELPVLEIEELKAQVAYDFELLVELIDLYLSERARQSEEMAQALAAGDYLALSRVAHTIKGSLGSLHADAARVSAQNLEMAARDQDVAKCSDFLPHLEQQLDELERQLVALRQSLGTLGS